MSNDSCQTPVALVIYNRPETTRRVFAAIRAARPKQLLIIADGPSPARPGDDEKCRAARAETEKIDWPCERLQRYAPQNFGCKRGVATGLDWVFQQVEEAIILEDDCLPHPDFFPFCEELLGRYRNERKVSMISGDCFFPKPAFPASYCFSRFGLIWGWATWRRAWKWYDIGMSEWPRLRQTDWLAKRLANPIAVHYWKTIFDDAHSDHIHGLQTWDAAWAFAAWFHDAVAATPLTNLVSNLGFQTDATHTTYASPYQNLISAPMQFPLRHPAQLVPDPEIDAQLGEKLYYNQSFAQSIFWRLRLPLSIGQVRRWIKLFR